MSTQAVSSGPGPDLISQTTLTFEQQAYRATAQLVSSQRNADNQHIYDARVRDYNANMTTGQKHDPPLALPIQIRSYVVTEPDQFGLVYPEQIGPYLTPTPPLTLVTLDLGTLSIPVRDPNKIEVGKRIGSGRWFSVGPDDGTPPDFVTPPGTTSSEGVVGQFEKFGGVGGSWYLQVA